MYVSFACKSGLVLRQLLGDKPDIKKVEESVRSLQTEGVVWGASTIVKVGYGFKYLRIIFTIVDDLVCFETVFQKTGGIRLKRICKYLKSILLTPQKLNIFRSLSGLAEISPGSPPTLVGGTQPTMATGILNHRSSSP
ncbi:hypothetical protein Rs2_38899 [Raphanus sativus]|nr:hypothetical protein Rs2_38899 [Raphanus sativus]